MIPETTYLFSTVTLESGAFSTVTLEYLPCILTRPRVRFPYTLVFYSTVTLEFTIAWITEPVNAEKHFERSGSVVISCVDNHLARRELSRVPGCHISAGNDRFHAQVCIGNSVDREQVMQHIDGRDGKYTYLPHESLLFPQLLEPEPEVSEPISAQSCADLLSLGEQSLMINDWSAGLVGSYLYALLYARPITSFISFAHCDGMPVTRNVPINREELLAYLESTL